jgi:universal stress protein E
MKLICATDLKDKTEVAIERAYQLRASAAAALKLVHVVSPLGADQGTLEQRLLGASSRLALRARHADAPAELVVRCGRPASVVSEEAGAAEFIIVGPHDADAVSNSFRGTFVENLLTTTRRPILIVRRPVQEAYRRVLLALDGSRATGQIVRVAERLPMATDVEFAAVHAHEPPYEAMMNTVGVGNISVASCAAASMSQAATMIHSRLRMHSVDWRRYRVLLMDARPGLAIRQAMRDTQPDLLVLGTRGHGRFRRAMLGSTAHEFLATADCDVLVVPDSQARGTSAEKDPGPRAA